MRDERRVIMLDQAGVHESHRFLVHLDPVRHLFEEGQLVQGSPISALPETTRLRRGRGSLSSEWVMVDLWGSGYGERTGRYVKILRERQRFSQAQLALSIGWSEEMVRRLEEGEYLPGSQESMHRLGEVIANDSAELERLMGKWGLDWTTLYNEEHPMPEDLPENQQRVLRLARWGWMRHWNGVSEMSGTKRESLGRYLNTGVVPTQIHHRRDFYEVTARLIGGEGNEELGKDVLRRHLGRRELGEYWRPWNVETIREEASVEREIWAYLKAKSYLSPEERA